MSRTCQQCAAWRPWGTQRVSRGGGPVADEPVGQCRARAPSIDPETASVTTATWPVVSADDWCAEHRPQHSPVARPGAAASSSREGHEA